MWALLLLLFFWERERLLHWRPRPPSRRRSRGIQDLLTEKILLGFKPPSPLDLGWTFCIFPFVVHVPCGSCVFDCLVDVWLDFFLSASPCDFSPFFLVFFEGIHSNRERSAYTGLAPYHLPKWGKSFMGDGHGGIDKVASSWTLRGWIPPWTRATITLRGLKSPSTWMYDSTTYRNHANNIRVSNCVCTL